MNKKYLYIIIAFLALIILCLATYKSSEKIVFKDDKESLIHDFGVLHKNQKKLYEYTFKFNNTKFDSLKIYGIKDGCDCTESTVKSGVYLKNETIYIKTKYDPFKYNDSGTIDKHIFLVTNQKISKFDTIFPLILKGKVE